ncbi:MAG TPA: hypothetical protein VM434_16495 [Beijerinckiaceae bacterium]|nr:hypothetical protein [Beijerinckiaceae bacterium]
MRKRPPIPTSVGLAAIAAALGAAAAAEPGGTAMRACAAFDLHALVLLDEHRFLATMTADRLAAAALALKTARSACRTGDRSALGLYERLDLEPVEDVERPLAVPARAPRAAR